MAPKDVLRNAPVVPLDFDAFDDDGEPLPIQSCEGCLPWHAEVVRDPVDPARVLVREWHAVGCYVVADAIGEK